MRGIVLAGGIGSRLYPLTHAVNKHLLPVHDKPMIYYPLATLMNSGIKEILLISNPADIPAFKRLLGTGSDFGINLRYETQEKPRGIVEAFLIAEKFIGNENVALILGDNLFHGTGLGRNLSDFNNINGAQIFAYRVTNPHDYGVIEFDKDLNIISISEKPNVPISNFAIPGLYFFDSSVKKLANEVKVSMRGELEIVSLLKIYQDRKKISANLLPRGTVWLDAGSPKALSDASNFVKIIEERQGYKIACLEEIAWRIGLISHSKLKKLAISYPKSNYQSYLLSLLDQEF
jgi:glucose-1-phosphate thymidylyltransferase